MADNYLERKFEEMEARKRASLQKKMKRRRSLGASTPKRTSEPSQTQEP